MARNELDKDVEEFLKGLFADNEQIENQTKLPLDGKQLAPSKKLEVPENQKPNTDIVKHKIDLIDGIVDQRMKQRNMLLWFIIILTAFITIVFVAMLAVNCICVVQNLQPVFSDIVVNIIGVSFFAELIATIKVVTEKLWDERQVLDSGAWTKTEEEL